MEIGTKLKNARAKSGLTQEKVAEEIGVTRQSMSNWENGRSYPDIVSVIKLSDLYSVSLDELLKEDNKMIEHLDDSTNIVKSRKRLTRFIMAGAYLLIWTAAVLLYHVVSGITGVQPHEGKAYIVAYVIGVLYLALPLVSAILSAMIGYMTERWRKWIFTAVFAAMEAAALLFTIGAEYDDTSLRVFYGRVARLMFGAFVFTLIACAVTMGIETLIRYLKGRKGSGISENDKTPGRTGA